jgi:hypothetical protein
MAAGRRTRKSLLDGPRCLSTRPERARNPLYPAPVSWLDDPSARAGATVAVAGLLCAIVVGVGCAALNLPETPFAASAALALGIGATAQAALSTPAALVLAPSHPILLGDRACGEPSRVPA